MVPLEKALGLRALFKDQGDALQTPTDHLDEIFNGPLIHFKL